MIDNDTTEEELLRETEVADEYRVKYQQAKIAVNNLVQPGQSANPAQNNEQIMQANRDNRRTYKYPKIELQKSSGELIDWLRFWSL